jgi:phage FluMu protein Com
MRTHPRDVRCEGCRILLAKLDDTGLAIRRNDLEVHYGGAGVVSIRCYRPRCRRLNTVRVSTTTPAGGAAA